MKLNSVPACESNRASVNEWLQARSERTSERIYWTSTTDLLFIVRCSHRRRFIYEEINPAFESRLGVSSETIGGVDISACLGKGDAATVCEALRACVGEGSEVRVRHRLALGGHEQAVETTVAPICDAVPGTTIRLIGSHRILNDPFFEDAVGGITDPRMNVRIISIQEDIQQRIASDLHDSTCQHLIAASLGLMRVRANLGDPGRTERLCDEIDASIDEALREIRAFSYLLHPQELTINGPRSTIERYAQGFAARTSLRVSTTIAPEIDRLPYEKQHALLRIVQEALTNVFRHAKATEVSIVLEATHGLIRLTISDNGRGITINPRGADRAPRSPGVGIPAMRARLQQMAGTLEIRSGSNEPHSGTVVRAVFPHDFAVNKRNRSRAGPLVKTTGMLNRAKH